MSLDLTLSPAPSAVADPAVRRAELRRARFDAQRVVQAETNLQSGKVYTDANGNERRSSRLRWCGHNMAHNAPGVSVKVSADGRGGLGGLQTCGSVWACPVCSEKINASRQAELHAGFGSWIAQGGALVFGTLTLSHSRRDSLEKMWAAISPAWNRTTSGAGVAWNGSKRVKGDIGDKARFGIVGSVRTVETKYGENGWHPHIHFVLFVSAGLTGEQLEDLRSRMFGRWSAALGKFGYRASEERGIDLRQASSIEAAESIADYLTKEVYIPEPEPSDVVDDTNAGRLAYEMTGSHSKQLGKGGLTPFQILARLVRKGDADDLDRWHEWERVSQGKRQHTWSRGMRALLLVDQDELTDEEIAAASFDGEVLTVIPWDVWKDGAWSYRRCDLIEAAEVSPEALWDLLADAGALSGPRGKFR